MPPRNTGRSLFSEQGLAGRISYERDKRGWTYETLARHLTDVGCAIDKSAIYRLEKGQPRRRITVDELVALAQVFETSVEELLLPPELAASQAAGELFLAWSRALEERNTAHMRATEAWEALREHTVAHPEIADWLDETVRTWARSFRPSKQLVGSQLESIAATFRLHHLTGSPEHRERYLAELDKWWVESEDDDAGLAPLFPRTEQFRADNG